MGGGGYAEITLVTLEVVLQGLVIGQDPLHFYCHILHNQYAS
jgi:hypothetical protein